jgi:hypothetical protein
MNYKHGRSHTTEHHSWLAMRQRCLNPRNPRYARYGGRGITICARWHDFTLFLVDMGPCPSPKHTLDRRDNDGPYDLENCRWATQLEQARNRGGRRPTCRLTYRGEVLTIVEWAERTDLSTNQIRNRLRKGWSTSRTLSEPIHTEKRAYHPRTSLWGRVL